MCGTGFFCQTAAKHYVNLVLGTFELSHPFLHVLRFLVSDTLYILVRIPIRLVVIRTVDAARDHTNRKLFGASERTIRSVDRAHSGVSPRVKLAVGVHESSRVCYRPATSVFVDLLNSLSLLDPITVGKEI